MNGVDLAKKCKAGGCADCWNPEPVSGFPDQETVAEADKGVCRDCITTRWLRAHDPTFEEPGEDWP